MNRFRLLASIVVAAAAQTALACPLCDGRYRRMQGDSGDDYGYGDAPRQVRGDAVTIVVRDHIRGEETFPNVPRQQSSVTVPYGFRCSAARVGPTDITPGAGDVVRSIRVVCQKEAEKWTVEQDCRSAQGEVRWDGFDRAGLNVVSVVLRCSPA